jgi:hypothetical protein
MGLRVIQFLAVLMTALASIPGAPAPHNLCQDPDDPALGQSSLG